VPELEEVIEMGKHSSNPKANELAVDLDALLKEVLSSENHKWSIGKEDAAAKKARQQRRGKFLDRYK
jgi:hypothetical protein